MYDGGFYIISTNAVIQRDILPLIISEDYFISTPNEIEIEIFESSLKEAGYFSRMFVPFGSEKTIVERDGRQHISWEYAQKSDFYVLKFRNFNPNMYEVKYAGSLIYPKLRFIMQTIYYDETETSSGIRGNPSYSDLTLMTDGSQQDRVEYANEQLNEFKELFLIIKNLNSKSRYKGVLQLFYETDGIPRRSNLLVLSYFSTLEALLTNGRGEGESITNQLIYKTQLLLNMTGKIDHKHFFGDISHDTLWKKLYKLRSNIAHGNAFDFKKDLSSLKNTQTVNDYLDLVIQKLLRFSLYNQQMVDDLKSC